MAIAGYSGTPLLKKLGIKPQMKVLLIAAPDNYFSLLEVDITIQLISEKQMPDFIHLFAKDIAVFKKGMAKVLPLAKKIRQLLFGYRGTKKLLVLPPI